jgi:pilus assembly protein Flp/PilA
MTSLLDRFARSQDGATAIEYGLIVSLIAVALIVGATAVGSQLNLLFNGISTRLVSP